MPKLLKATAAVLAGLVAWFVVATVLNFSLRKLFPAYESVEKAMDFSLAMLIARLVIGLVSSLCAGLACAMVWPESARPGHVLALLLLVLFIPVHIGLWSKFPLWYHAFFLGTLAPATLAGRRLRGSTRADAA